MDIVLLKLRVYDCQNQYCVLTGIILHPPVPASAYGVLPYNFLNKFKISPLLA